MFLLDDEHIGVYFPKTSILAREIIGEDGLVYGAIRGRCSRINQHDRWK